MQEVIFKVDETIETIDSSDIVFKLKELKQRIDEDLDVQKLLHDFNVAKNEYGNQLCDSKKLIQAKKKLYNHFLVAEYRELYSILNRSLLMFNKKLSSLVENKNPTCGRI